MLLVELLGLGVILRQVRDDEAGVGAFGEVFGFGDNAARTAPAFLRAVDELGEDARGVTGLFVPLPRLHQFVANFSEQSSVACEAQKVINAVRFAPLHETVAGETGVGPDDDAGLGKAPPDALDERRENVGGAIGGVAVGRTQLGHKQMVAAGYVERQVAVVAIVAV